MANEFDLTKMNRYDRVLLSEDTLFPAVSPNAQVGTVTTWGTILSKITSLFSRNKGYFSSAELLNQTYPAPATGYTAYVANSASATGYYIYNSVNGVWIATTTPAPAVSVNMNDYVPKSAIKQVSGTSETDVMSQKAVTELVSSMGGNFDGFLPLSGGTLTGALITRSVINFLNSEGKKPVTVGYQMDSDLGVEVFNIANSFGGTKHLGTFFSTNFKVGNKVSGAYQVWHAGNLDLETFNAATASRLRVPVQLWGNPFDGSKSLAGPIIVQKINFNNGFALERNLAGRGLVFTYNGVIVASINETGIINAGGDKTYAHTQTTPSSVWTINHNLGKQPSVSILDSAGTEVVGEVEHIDNNTLIVRFTGDFTGTATLN